MAEETTSEQATGEADQAPGTPEGASDNLDILKDVDVTFSFMLGYAHVTLDELTEMGEQSLVELNRIHNEPIDILANGKLFARGEVVTIGENFGVQLTEIVRPLSPHEGEVSDDVD